MTLFTPPGHEDLVGRQWNGTFACDNVQETYEVLRAAGVEFVAAQAQPWGKYMVLKNPDGNPLVLSSSWALSPGSCGSAGTRASG